MTVPEAFITRSLRELETELEALRVSLDAENAVRAFGQRADRLLLVLEGDAEQAYVLDACDAMLRRAGLAVD